jgi:hypothetical protein
MIAIAFWGTIIAGSCIMVRIAAEIHTLNVGIKKMDAFVKDMKNFNTPSS